MGRYIIVSKYPKGNEHGKRYEVEYQVRECGSAIFKTMLYCLCSPKGKVRYCYDGDNPPLYVNLDDEKQNKEFLNEFYKFQKGGSYRRANPVIIKSVASLLQSKQTVEKTLDSINLQLKLQQDELDKHVIENYFKGLDVNAEKLKELVDKISSISNDKYYICHKYDTTLYIRDKKQQKPIMKVCVGPDGGLDIQDLTVNDIKEFI